VAVIENPFPTLLDNAFLRKGGKLKLEIPNDHPWMDWLTQYAEDRFKDKLLDHGILTVILGGIEQRYDLVETVAASTHKEFTFYINCKMYGKPEVKNDD
jgi:hypothetical protein